MRGASLELFLSWGRWRRGASSGPAGPSAARRRGAGRDGRRDRKMEEEEGAGAGRVGVMRWVGVRAALYGIDAGFGLQEV